ncbi:MAG: DUF1549 domain-containing protein [Prosthecobacter sp.]|jgi:hypothetical protein|uniref:DUF1549 domain-containing protein n=1 Tax=Prosthecobacter sp. TaxID=1965333 RepID=UPI0019FD0140|nr:DUF1549 domain-containing protein [Prosthecobacter sp.]MBE2287894.1 DUF1549 domain-containing protein [Prosthecobacter sp.]
MKIPLLIATSALTLAAHAAPDLKATAAKIDELVNAKLAKEKITPNKPASDEVFVRRVYLDVAGRIPTLHETTEFLKSSDPEKRAKLIDRLLASDGYVQNFYNYWADILRLKSNMVGGGQSLPAFHAYSNWLKDSLRTNKPYDQMVRDVVTADGKTYENGAVGFYIRDYNMPLDNMAVTTQVFLGTSMVCAQCHNHPFDKWTQMDYYQMAAHTYGMTSSNGLTNPLLAQAIYGGGTAKKKATRYGGAAGKFDMPEGIEKKDVGRAMTEILRPLRYNTVIDDSHRKALRLPHDYQYSDAKPKQTIEPLIPASFSKDGKIAKEGHSPITAYAAWMTSKENPRFTTVIANRLWKKLMGQGLIEPVDEITDSTVPSNPQLMSFLEDTMKAANYDMKALLRGILNSAAYQREAYTKDVELGEIYNFPGPLLRRMSAEQIWDSMVALYKPNPDTPSIETKIEAETSLRRVEWLDRALNSLSPKELQQYTVKVAQKQKELAAEVRAAQEKLDAATKEKDEDAIREARRAIQSQRKRIDEAVDAIVYDAGFKRFAELADAGRLNEIIKDEAFVKEVELVLKSGKSEKLSLEGALGLLAKQRRAKHQEQIKSRTKADAERFEVTSKNEKTSLAAWENFRDTYMLRAADLRSPAPNGHFLREFGQSDRELVQNSRDEASVSQALMLLNGKVFTNLMNRYSVIARSMDKAKKDGGEAVIDSVYLSLLSRKASAEEKSLLKPIADNADGTDRGDVLWTVLNTRQFFFIQ